MLSRSWNDYPSRSDTNVCLGASRFILRDKGAAGQHGAMAPAQVVLDEYSGQKPEMDHGELCKQSVLQDGGFAVGGRRGSDCVLAGRLFGDSHWGRRLDRIPGLAACFCLEDTKQYFANKWIIGLAAFGSFFLLDGMERQKRQSRQQLGIPCCLEQYAAR